MKLSNFVAKRGVALVAAGLAAAMALTACGSGEGLEPKPSGPASEAGGDVTIEFMQWWEGELPDGVLKGLVDEFEKANPGIKVEILSGPFASIKDQIVAGAASGTLPDVMGLDTKWVNDFAKQGAIVNLTDLMKEVGYDDSQLAAQVKVDGATVMVPVVNFAYPLFANTDLLTKAGVSKVPTTRAEFLDATKKVAAGGSAAGFVTALGLEKPNGVGIDIMPWVWASGGSMLDANGGPNVNNPEVSSAISFIKEMWDAGVISPGALTMKEQDKVEEFTNGRVALMISSLAHINLIRKNNPDLNFEVAPVPVVEGFTGEPGVRYGAWGIGVAKNSQHPKEAWKLIEFLMSKDANAKLASAAHAFPGNSQVQPDFSAEDPLFQKAFDIWKAGHPVDEFGGQPQAEGLQRSLDEQLQEVLANDKPVDEALQAVQDAWKKVF
ncbi:MAG: sugar ABC transporter substrate-binding protein [Propionicimonas sp.]